MDAELRRWLQGDVADVAPQLIGMRLASHLDGRVVLRITEVEAYSGAGMDAASHAHGGRTRRNATMFGEAGHLYVYRSYGIHWCCNVVAGSEDIASGVLIRAGAVVEGEEVAWQRRAKAKRARDLARGPGNVGAALGVTGDQDGIDLLNPHSSLQLLARIGPAPRIARSARIGISRNVELPWRWWDADDPSVSAHRRAHDE